MRSIETYPVCNYVRVGIYNIKSGSGKIARIENGCLKIDSSNVTFLEIQVVQIGDCSKYYYFIENIKIKKIIKQAKILFE